MGDEQSKEANSDAAAEEAWVEMNSKFTADEMREWRKSYLSQFPDGYITKPQFKEMYEKNYPRLKRGDIFVNQVFKRFDLNGDDKINFDEYVLASGIIGRGSDHEKLCWMFKLFDLNNDQMVTKTEMLSIMRALYNLHGKRATVKGRAAETPYTHTDRIFEKYDLNQDQKLSLDEFLKLESSDAKLMELVYGTSVKLH